MKLLDYRHAPLALALAVFWHSSGFAAELHGHRGARGLAPENTLPAFRQALEIGVDCLELDIGMSGDGRLIVAHDPTLNPDLVRRDGAWIAERTPLRNLSAAQLQTLDVGRINPDSKYAKRYPKQVPVDGTPMPLLDDVLALPGLRANPAVCLNIEIKTAPNTRDITHSPERIADELVRSLDRHAMRKRSRIQSFDWRGLAHLRKTAPDIALSFLSAERPWLDNIERGRPGASSWLAGMDVDAHDGSVAIMVKALGGQWWSPYYRDLSPQELERAHALGLKVIVWTINDAEEIRQMLQMGVDGVITDRPDLAKPVIDAHRR
jgi:glycerophosphoryl diester phosphodiesterase